MLSYQGIGWPQAGQWLPGKTMDRRRGKRCTRTLAKLPKIRPRQTQAARRNVGDTAQESAAGFRARLRTEDKRPAIRDR